MADAPAPDGGGQARLILRGSAAQQIAQVSGLLVMFAIFTVLARKLTLAELGIYGLLSSLAGYLVVIQNAAAGAAVRNMAAAAAGEARDRVFTTAIFIYALAGLGVGLLLAILGVAVTAIVDIPAGLESQAREGAALAGLVTFAGWPLTIYRDAMRANQMFVRAAVIDVWSVAAFAVLMLALAFGGASLAVLIGASAAIPLLAGVVAAVYARLIQLPYRFRPSLATRGEAREFAGLAGYLSAAEAAVTLIYTIDRIVLGAFNPVATVALYEGPMRAHNLVRALNTAVTTTVLPTASRYVAGGDARRLDGLLIQGMRYTLALIVPLVVTGMVLAGPLLELWLGSGFEEGGVAMAILLSYWLVNGASGVLNGVIVGGGQAPVLARLAWMVVVGNVVLALALTPWLGLEGIAIATAVPYFLVFPSLLRVALGLTGVSAGTVARRAFAPAYGPAIILALALGAARLVLGEDAGLALAGIALAGVAAYWLGYYRFSLDADERETVGAALRRA